MKKGVVIAIVLVLIMTVFIGTFKIVEYVSFKNSLSELEKYDLGSDDVILKTFVVDKNEYVMTIKNFDEFNLLLKVSKDYYVLDSSNYVVYENGILVHNRDVYVHPIGIRSVVRYSIDDFKVKKENISFNFQDTPNFSPLHMNIDSIDDEFVYFSSLKIDGKIKDGENVKCYLDKKTCEYN